jgi:hypothetical protein
MPFDGEGWPEARVRRDQTRRRYRVPTFRRVTSHTALASLPLPQHPSYSVLCFVIHVRSVAERFLVQ